MNQPNPARDALLQELRAWSPLDGPDRWSDDHFNAHVRALFAHQFAHNAPYRAFCQQRGATPEHVHTWRDVPAAPTDAFKHVALTCAIPPLHTFLTSGTTQGARGAHHFGTLEVYEASLRKPFIRYMLADGPPIKTLSLIPPADALPDSSLSHMISTLWPTIASPGSVWGVHASQGSLTFDREAITQTLHDAITHQEPLMILSTAFALAELLSWRQQWRLPPGSRIMETGGFKGRTQEIARDLFYQQLQETFGVPSWAIVAEYSMTELSSQAYTDTLRSTLHHHHTSPPPNHLRTPPWARVVIVDPITLSPLDDPSQLGLIRWIDLANTESVLAVQTSDLGHLTPDGALILIGRAPDAQLRGCSLTIEELLHARSS